jgi:hypothetical protein
MGICPGVDGYFWKSLDGGNNWAQASLIYNEGDGVSVPRDGLGSSPALFCPSPNVVIAGAKNIHYTYGKGGIKLGQIMISSDGGQTWVDKTGNLAELGAFDTNPSYNTGLNCKQIEVLY